MTAALSKTAFGLAVKLSRTRIRQLVGEGLPCSSDGKIDLAEGRAWMEAHLDPERREARKPGSTGKAASAGELRIAKMKAQIALLEQRHAREAGDLVERVLVERAIFERARLERDRWTGWIARTAPMLAGRLGSDPSVTFAALDKAVRDHLAELSATAIEVMADV